MQTLSVGIADITMIASMIRSSGSRPPTTCRMVSLLFSCALIGAEDRVGFSTMPARTRRPRSRPRRVSGHSRRQRDACPTQPWSPRNWHTDARAGCCSASCRRTAGSAASCSRSGRRCAPHRPAPGVHRGRHQIHPSLSTEARNDLPLDPVGGPPPRYAAATQPPGDRAAPREDGPQHSRPSPPRSAAQPAVDPDAAAPPHPFIAGRELPHLLSRTYKKSTIL
jgi:hypothetical protein